MEGQKIRWEEWMNGRLEARAFRFFLPSFQSLPSTPSSIGHYMSVLPFCLQRFLKRSLSCVAMFFPFWVACSPARLT